MVEQVKVIELEPESTTASSTEASTTSTETPSAPSTTNESSGTTETHTDSAENPTNGASSTKPTERVWSEKGIGDIRLNVLNDDNSKSRIIIRRDKTHQLIVNMPIFNNITTDSPSDTTVKVIGFNLTSEKSAVPECYLIRFRSSKDQNEFVGHLNQCKSNAKPLENKSS